MDLDESAYLDRKVAFSLEYDCACEHCDMMRHGYILPGEPGSCNRDERLQLHSIQVCHLETVCLTQVNLVVGPVKTGIVAPRAILAFYSRFFKTAFYGSFAESGSDTLDLPEDDVEAIATFVLWAKTGQLYSSLRLEALWALGKRLQSDLFSNEAMFYIYGRDQFNHLCAEEAKLAYSLTIPGSKLREYIRRLIICEGPLRRAPITDEVRLEDWGRLIREGGELVYDIIVEERASFCQDLAGDDDALPYHYQNHGLYLEDVPEMSVEDVIEAKRKDGKL